MDGTFYSFPNVEGMMERLNLDDDTALAALLDKVGVAVVPGSAFRLEGHIRLSFATSLENLERALERLASSLSECSERLVMPAHSTK
ncbi:MAG: aminotransferase class I/II-fold pyridoxal phosphate-dependent enzyme [Thiolinea sp.]